MTTGDPIEVRVLGALLYVRRGRKSLTVLTPDEAERFAAELIVRADEIRATRPHTAGDPAVPW